MHLPLLRYPFRKHCRPPTLCPGLHYSFKGVEPVSDYVLCIVMCRVARSSASCRFLSDGTKTDQSYVDLQLTSRWELSQKGLFFDAPQRQRKIRFPWKNVRPFLSCKATSPRSSNGPSILGITLSVALSVIGCIILKSLRSGLPIARNRVA